MSSSEKLVLRLKCIPSDFTFDEAERLFNHFDYKLDNKGKTSGSRVIFFRESDNKKIMLHKPHNPSVLRKSAVKQIYEFLIDNGDIEED